MRGMVCGFALLLVWPNSKEFFRKLTAPPMNEVFRAAAELQKF